MSTKSLLHQAKLNEWISRFADQKASGLSVTEWCVQNNLSTYKYFYWKRILKEEAIEQVLPEIVPLTMPPVSNPIIPSVYTPVTEVASATRATCTSNTSTSFAKLSIGDVSIELDSSAPEAFICSLIKAVRHA